VDTLLQSVPRLEGGRFELFLFPRCSCARFPSLDVNRATETTSPEPELPPDDTAPVASGFSCFPAPCSVSTTLSNPRGSSLGHPFTLYRALVAGRRSARAAAAFRVAEVGGGR
jgi:hypothetical protein